MEDTLPLLPDKEGIICADVRSILREVFRHVDNLPSTKLFKGKDDENLNDVDVFAAKETEWVDTLSSEYGKLHQQEIKLQYEHAKRLARDTPPNQYHLHSPTSSSDQTWKQEAALLRRRDLKPTLEQNANCKESLWVKNILNRSSGNVTAVEKTYFPAISNVPHRPFDEGSLQSLSIGEIATRPAPPIPVVPLASAAPKHIISIPSKFHFINFKVGQLYTKCLRLVNISKFEERISVRPPSRRELNIELCSRLVVTSGSAAEMKIHFRPKDVRPFTEQLDVCVSNGQRLCIPISCFLEPPLLEILIDNEGSSNSSFSKSIETSNNVIDLGTKLIGDIHRVEFLLRCSAEHASFFLLSEDAWIDYTLEYKADQSGNGNDYGIEVDSFFISPVRWLGGDDVKGVAVCRATNIGLQTAALRVISSTAITRQLHLVADTITFTPKHITIQAHEKVYDICSEDDPSCEYYVNLGVAFPHRSLTETISIRNHSPVNYNYTWRSRTWGVCCCWTYSEDLLSDDQSDDNLCPGAREAKSKSKKVDETTQLSDKELKGVVVDEPVGCIDPYSTIQLTVRAPDVGSELGTQRSVLMYKLILKDIPKESVAEEDECLILSSKDVAEGTTSGAPAESSGRSRQVCEVLCAQMEVWWEVVPVRFTLDPAVLRLPHSRRVKSVTTQIRATQLCGVSNIRANWELPGELPSPVTLTPEQPTLMTFALPLSERKQHTDIIRALFGVYCHVTNLFAIELLLNRAGSGIIHRLTSEGDEWVSSTVIKQYCDTRHPSIKPSFIWLGVFPPGAAVTASLTVHNDTHEDIAWCATVCRWCGERGVGAACEDAPPCAACRSRACTCSLLTPTRGTLKHSQRDELMYKVIAPDSDGCVATLVRVHRTDVSTTGSSLDARASLLAYRVLSPHLVLRVLPCYGDKRGTCEGCSLDAGDEGTAVLHSRAALVKGGRSCYRLRLTNITPLPTSGAWEPALEGQDVLEVTFQPNEFEVGGYSEIDITVVLEAKQVTDRRLFIRRASVAHTRKPLYLVIDTAVSGVEVTVEFPTGDKETLSFASFKLIQKDKRELASVTEPTTDQEIFTEYDLKRKKQQENICYCDHEMVYIPPEKKPELPKDIDDGGHQVEILEEPPPLTRVCPCTSRRKPDLPEACEPYCLQFKQVPLRTVISRLMVLRNVSQLDTRWRASVRRWPRRHVRTIEKEQWAGDVREPGVVLQCEPPRGELRACTETFVEVSVYADCWGLYRDQILIQIENLEPIILDVWIEAVGLPLEFPLRPSDAQTQPMLWLSNTDPERALLIKNTSRADLLVHAFIVRENAENSWMSESLIEEMDTSVELFLTADHGVQDDTFFQVEPLECLMSAGERTSFKLRLLPRHERAPNTILLLRSTLVKNTGDSWYRPDPPLQFVRLRQIQRTSRLQASCSEISVTLCALDMPCDDVVRVRKRFHLRNVGDDQLDVHSVTEAPWSVDVARRTCAAHCTPNEANKTDRLKLTLAPRSSTEMIVEVTLRTNEVWPEGDTYSPRSVSSSALYFKDMDDAVLLRIPLILEIEYPVLSMKPETIDFGNVSDGGTRKSYITVSHSSQTKTLYLVTSWTGDDTFRLWPPTLTLPPRTSARIYIEYTACWSSDSNACGAVHVRARGGRWCAASAHVSARARLCAPHAPAHQDHTDDTNLIPQSMVYD